MKRIFFLLTTTLFIFISCKKDQTQTQTAENTSSVAETPKEKGVAIVIHGGAGTIKKENITPEQEVAYRDKLHEALDVGYKILEEGGSALDAAQKAVNVMEDSPLFQRW